MLDLEQVALEVGAADQDVVRAVALDLAAGVPAVPVEDVLAGGSVGVAGLDSQAGDAGNGDGCLVGSGRHGVAEGALAV